MKNKKGFTLVELLGVLVVLSVILMIAYPLITSYVRQTKEKAYEVQMELILTSLRDYANDHREWLPQNDGDYITLTLGQLKSVGIIKDSVINPLDGKEIEDSMEFKITKNDTRYQYEIIENTIETREDKAKSPSIELSDSPLLYLPLDSEYVEPGVKGYDYDGVEIAVTIDNKVDMTKEGIYLVKYNSIDGNGINTYAYRTIVVGNPNGSYVVYENGTPLLFDPVNNVKCTSATSSATGTNDTCMKWYAFLDSEKESKVNLILDHNTTGYIAWNEDGGETPDTVNAKLQVDITNWNAAVKSTARLISASEVNQIAPTAEGFTWTETDYTTWYYLHNGNKTEYTGAAGSNTYAWLFDNTNNCTTYGCNVADSGTFGYWTSSFDSSGRAWYVILDGGLYGIDVSSDDHLGVRPVIEVDKSIFE